MGITREAVAGSYELRLLGDVEPGEVYYKGDRLFLKGVVEHCNSDETAGIEPVEIEIVGGSVHKLYEEEMKENVRVMLVGKLSVRASE